MYTVTYTFVNAYLYTKILATKAASNETRFSIYVTIQNIVNGLHSVFSTWLNVDYSFFTMDTGERWGVGVALSLNGPKTEPDATSHSLPWSTRQKGREGRVASENITSVRNFSSSHGRKL